MCKDEDDENQEPCRVTAEFVYKIMARPDETAPGGGNVLDETDKWVERMESKPECATPEMLPAGAPVWSADKPRDCLRGFLAAADDKAIEKVFSQTSLTPVLGVFWMVKYNPYFECPTSDILDQDPFSLLLSMYFEALYHRLTNTSPSTASTWTAIKEKMEKMRQCLVDSSRGCSASPINYQLEEFDFIITKLNDIASVTDLLDSVDPETLWTAIEKANAPLVFWNDLRSIRLGRPGRVSADEKEACDRLMALLNMYYLALGRDAIERTKRDGRFLAYFRNAANEDKVKQRLQEMGSHWADELNGSAEGW